MLGVTLLARGVAAWSLSQTGHARHPLVDAQTYWMQASQLVTGKDPFAAGFYQPPGYPLFLASIQAVAGPNLWAPRIIQMLLGWLTVVLLIRLGRRLGGQDAPWAGAMAGLIFGLHPSVLMFELDLLTPALTMFAVAFVLWVAQYRERPLALGCSAGLTALMSSVHPSMLILGLAVIAWAALQRSRAALLAALLGLCLGLMPLAQQNLDRFGRLQVTSTNAGLNFYLGNSAQWRDSSFLRPGLQFRKLALEARPAERDGFERNEYWKSRALSDIAAAPHLWVGALFTKALWSVSDTEIPRNEDYRCRTEEGPLAWLGLRLVRYGLVFPLAILGALVVWRRRPEDRFVVLAWAALHLPVVLFIVSDRYRMTTWPMMSLLAPLGLRAGWGWLKGDGRRYAVGAAVCCLPWIPLDERTQMDPAWCAHIDANLAFMDGDLATAEVLYMEAVRADPGDWSAHRWLSETLAKRGAYREAIVHCQVILDGFPDSFPTLRTMSRLQEKVGNVAAAAEYMLRAYAVPGKRTSTGMSALRLLKRSGQAERIEALLRADEALARRWREAN